MRKFIQDALNLKENADFQKTKSTINDGISLRGYNVWILACSTILASIGLDTNSTAVIIGAMLISPLMSPILGIGLSLAIHDKQVLLRSLKNLLIAVVISLTASVLYFLLSPLGEPTSELQARTFPTLLDALVALFGGIAGIVSISRHQQTTAIPGVAIATALMPPLCTAGFGIATANWTYFFGAFYLFFINAVFISLATYLIVRYLDFPEKEFVNTKVARHYHRWFIVLSMVALAPSIYFLYTLYKNEVVKKEIELLVLSPIQKQGNEIIKWEIVSGDTAKLIKVYHSGMPLSDSLKNAVDSSLRMHKMGLYHLLSMRVNLTKEEVSALSAEMTKQMFQEMHLEELKIQEKGKKKPADTASYHQILQEVRIAFPFIDTMSNGLITLPNAANGYDTLPVVFYSSAKPVSKSQTNQLYTFLRVRLAKDTVVLIKK
jgi:uncharacterized hydrophobic protein (TIGR00271 family)